MTFCTARWLCLLSLVAIFLTGYVGYFVVDAIWPKFYYEPVTRGKNVWLFMQLACIVLFALGAVLAFTDIRRPVTRPEVGRGSPREQRAAVGVNLKRPCRRTDSLMPPPRSKEGIRFLQ